MLTRILLLFMLLALPMPVAAEERYLLHRYGETRISGTPERVVSLSFIGHDFMLGLGVAPFALRYWYGDGPFGVWPWAVDALGDAQPLVIYGGIDVEAIALMQPDLILAQWSGITETEYRLLSRIAPTLPPPVGETDYSATWQQMTRQAGIALNKEAEAEAQIADIEARFEALRAAYPAWQGATAVTVFPANLGAYTSKDIRSHFLRDLGFVISPKLEALVRSNAFFVTLSREDLTPIDTDLLVWLTTGDQTDTIDAIPLRQSMRAYQEGREIVLDPNLTAAISHSSPLAIGFIFDRLVPMIEAAMDGDPMTPIPHGHEARQ